MSRIPRTVNGPDRHRLDTALVAASQSADATTRAKISAFETILRHSPRKKPASSGHQTSLREEIDRLTMPEIMDPGIFMTDRMCEILQHLMSDILPGLGMPDDVTEITETILREEIESQREILDRIIAGGSL